MNKVKFSFVLAFALIVGAFGLSSNDVEASSTCASGSSAYVDSNYYYKNATTIDMTITKSTSGTCDWTAYIQYGSETGNYWTISGTAKSGYVSPSSPSYRSWVIDDLEHTGIGYLRLYVVYEDGSTDTDYFEVDYRP